MYSLGLLEDGDARSFEEHLVECSICAREVDSFRETAALLPLSLQGQKPHPRVRERLMARTKPPREEGVQVWKEWPATPEASMHVIVAGEGEWQSAGEGVLAKQLYSDPARDSVTMLVRMSAGATYPAHRHAGPEQCYVLEGDLEVNDVRLGAGDYQCVPGGSIHGVTRTEHGCLLLIVSSQRDELLA